MFKKTLVAASLLAAFNVSAIQLNYGNDTAGKYDDPTVVSAEGNALVTKVDVPALSAVLGNATYIEGDTFTFTFAGGQLDFATALPATIAIDGAADTDVGGAGDGADTNAVTLTLKDATQTSVTYEIASGAVIAVGDLAGANDNDTFVGSTISLSAGDFVLEADSLSSDVTVTLSAARNVLALDTGADSKPTPTILQVKDQYAAEVASGDAFDGIVDVNALRLNFSDDASHSKTVDTLEVTFTDNAYANPAESAGVKMEVAGDFSFLDTDAEEEGIQYGSGKVAVTNATASTLKVEADKISWTVAADGSDDLPANTVLTIDVTDTDGKSAASAIPVQTFSVSANVLYGPASDTDKVTASLLSGAAGSWTLNGAQASIPSMPFGNAYAQYITVSNTSEQDGDIEVDMYIDGVKSTHSLTAKAAKQSVTNISAELSALVAAAGATDANVAFDLVVNAPSDNVLVTALYYVKGDADRAVLGVVNK